MSRIRWGLRSARRRAGKVDLWIERSLVLPIGQVTLTESRFLGELIRSLSGPGPIIEIGTLFGWSTRIMALSKEPERELITVDAFIWNPLDLSQEKHFKITSQILEESIQKHNVRLVRSDKDAFFANYDGPPPAMAFLDAIHTYEETAKDIAWARKLGAELICVHDYDSTFPGVIQAVDEAGGPIQCVERLAVLK